MKITPYERKHRRTLLNLIFYSQYNHTHLDWYHVGTWLDAAGDWVRLAWEGDDLRGAMGLSPALSQTCWMRLLVIHQQCDVEMLVTLLWSAILPELAAQDMHMVGVLMLNKWMEPYLQALHFEHREDVVTMYRTGTRLPPPKQSDVTVRPAYLEHLPQMLQVDHTAFDPLWQLTPDEMRQAQRQSASSSIALLNDNIVGYQISTRHNHSGHLARLAVLPNQQGQGIGGMLLDDLIRQFGKRSVFTITVNTQASNTRSQHLYRRYHFWRNGFDLPIWIYTFTSEDKAI